MAALDNSVCFSRYVNIQISQLTQGVRGLHSSQVTTFMSLRPGCFDAIDYVLRIA